MSLDFLLIRERDAKKTKEGELPTIEIYPDFNVFRTTDLMTRGHAFYAIWDEAAGLWSENEWDVARLVDEALWAHRNARVEETGRRYSISLMEEFSSGAWRNFQQYMKNIPDSSKQLNERMAFANSDVKKTDYVSKRLSYSLEQGSYDSWDEIVGTLYNPAEREKIEWIIGAIVSGDSAHIHKFGVFYGPPGSGKSTIMNIIQKKLFPPYCAVFDAKALTQSSNAFSTEVFRSGPLIAIQHDGDLSKIEDNSKINAIISHEPMTMNEKFKPSYESAVLAFLLMGTNKPVKITDAKAGIIRRLIDIHPSNKLLAPQRYQALMGQIDFELGAIAQHCLEVYQERGKNFYDGYRAVEMMLQTDIFYNFIEDSFDIFSTQDGVSLDQAYSMYKEFIQESGVEFKLAKYKFREEFRNYFENFQERAEVDGIRVRSWYSGFRIDKFRSVVKIEEEEIVLPLVMDETESLFDEMMAEFPAQYAKDDGSPITYWDKVETTLADLDTSQVHYVRVPEHHIVIDFDLTDEDGNKSPELNLKAASEWPPTYSEFSKSGGGIHLHYNYVGDVDLLSRVHDEGIEVKVFTGRSSLRRRLSKCNNVPVASLNGGLKLREKKVIGSTQIENEKHLRALIAKAMELKVHPNTAPSFDFIVKVLNDAKKSGMPYDVRDLQGPIIAFANGSSHHSLRLIELAMDLPYKSDIEFSDVEPANTLTPTPSPWMDLDYDREVAFDCEVYQNLFVISWGYVDSDEVVTMINPKPHEVEQLFRLKLIGFNNRRYDNHILYARSMGASNMALYELSQKIIGNQPGGMLGAAYELAWTDIFDYSTSKMSLKKWEAELGLKHVEMDIPWDQPVPKELWQQVAEYCENDVQATKAVHKHLEDEYTARLILAELSGLPASHTTAQHMARLIFGEDRAPQGQFNWFDMGEPKLDSHGDIIDEPLFPGYKYVRGKSTYRDEDVNEGGYVYAEPGIYTDVALLDVASMHPNSIIQLNLFGKYTKNFKDIVDARIAIKREQYDDARKLYAGRLTPYLKDKTRAKKLSYALKIAINIVYGLTAASFPNAFKDPRNKDNIVAKRGALFMVDLKHFVQEQGFTVAHIKTDSIKIPNATPEIIAAVFAFGEKYGYEFEHEETYERLALTTKADYIAKTKDGTWTATGATMARPYVFKTLFTHEPIEFSDLTEIKQVQGASKMYLDFTEGYASEAGIEKELHFVGKVGTFVAIEEGKGGGILVKSKDDKFHAVTGTKDRRFMEAHIVQELGKEDDIDMAYYREYVDNAIAQIQKLGDFEWFAS